MGPASDGVGDRPRGDDTAPEGALGEAVLGEAAYADDGATGTGWHEPDQETGAPSPAADEDRNEATGWEIFRRMAMSCPLPVFATDAVGRHVFVNRRWSEFTGVDPDEALGWGWERAIHPHDLLAVTNQWGRAHSGGDGVWVRLRLLRPDGLHRPAILQATPATTDSGAPRFVGTLTPLPPSWSRHEPGGYDGEPTGSGPFRAGAGRDDPPRPESLPLGWSPGPGGPASALPIPSPRASGDPVHGDEPLDEPALGDNLLAGGGVLADDDRFADDRALTDDRSPGDQEGPPATDGAAGARARERRRDHLTWDGTRRRAAAPDGGDIWSGPAETQSPPALGGEWRAAVALHARAADGHCGADQPSRPLGALGGHEHGPVGRVRWAHGAGPATGHASAGTGTGAAAGGGGAGAGGAHASGGSGGDGHPRGGGHPYGGHPGGGSGDGHGRGWHERVPPAECGCLYGELARAEAACRDRERWLTGLLAELPAAVLLADANSQIVGVNQAYCDLFDLPEAPVDLVGTDCRLLLRPRTGLVDDPAGFADRLDRLLRRRRTLRREAVMFSDGRVFERSHLPLVSPYGYRGHLWLYVDVTDRRILDAEIEGLISEL
jgi:PAS domain S-box-containing protein